MNRPAHTKFISLCSHGGKLCTPDYHPLCDLSRMRMSKTMTFNVVSANFITAGTLPFYSPTHLPNSASQLCQPSVHLVTGLVSLSATNTMNGIWEPSGSNTSRIQAWSPSPPMAKNRRDARIQQTPQLFPKRNGLPPSKSLRTHQNSTPRKSILHH